MKTQTKPARKRGLRHWEVNPGGPKGYVLNYQYHGSTFVHAEEFSDSADAQKRIAELQRLAK